MCDKGGEVPPTKASTPKWGTGWWRENAPLCRRSAGCCRIIQLRRSSVRPARMRDKGRIVASQRGVGLWQWRTAALFGVCGSDVSITCSCCRTCLQTRLVNLIEDNVHFSLSLLCLPILPPFPHLRQWRARFHKHALRICAHTHTHKHMDMHKRTSSWNFEYYENIIPFHSPISLILKCRHSMFVCGHQRKLSFS